MVIDTPKEIQTNCKLKIQMKVIKVELPGRAQKIATAL